MSAEVGCGECGQRFAAAPHLWGTQVACPSCQKPLRIPDFNKQEPAQAAPPQASGQAAAPRQQAAFAPIEVGCAACKQRFAAPQELAGKELSCPSCSAVIRVPSKPKEVSHHSRETGGPTHDWFADQMKQAQASPYAGYINADGTLGPMPVAPPQRAAYKSSRYIDAQAIRQQRRFIAYVVGGVALLLASPFLIYGLYIGLSQFGSEVVMYSSTPFDVDSSPPPALQPRPSFSQLKPGVLMAHTSTGAGGAGPGFSNQLYVYLPAGEHAPESLGCVFIAPAGATVLTGMGLGASDQFEHIPYVLAGYAVVAYELDGDPGPLDEVTDDQFRDAFKEYRDSMAGLINARNAIDFALATLPEVDPKRLYAAGHSSAGRQALLLAAHEPRISACIAYNPVSDVEDHASGDSATLFLMAPGCGPFLKKSSPRTHENALNCPVFLFHSTGDEIVPFAQSEAMAGRLQAKGKQAEFFTFEGGNHYESMLSPGIARGIAWLKTLESTGAPQPNP